MALWHDVPDVPPKKDTRGVRAPVGLSLRIVGHLVFTKRYASERFVRYQVAAKILRRPHSGIALDETRLAAALGRLVGAGSTAASCGRVAVCYPMPHEVPSHVFRLELMRLTMLPNPLASLPGMPWALSAVMEAVRCALASTENEPRRAREPERGDAGPRAFA